MRYLVLPVLLVSVSAVGAAGEGAGAPALLEAARRTHQEAAAASAAARTAILEERNAIFARVNELQRQLDRERAAGLASSERLDAATRRREKRALELQRENEMYARLLDQVAEACGLRGQLPSDDLPALGARVRGALSARLTRIEYDSRLRSRTLSVADRTGRAGELPVISLGNVQELAAGPNDAGVGYVRRNGTTAFVSGPLFTESSRGALQEAARGNVTVLPCDVSGSLSTQLAVEPWTLRGWVMAGGVFMWPIMLAVFLATGLAIERFVALHRLRVQPLVAEKVLEDLRAGRAQAAREQVAAGETPLDRVLRAGLDAMGLSRPSREAALEAALLHEQPLFEKSLSLLAALAAIAPLLGLLGTVTGMIGTFEAIAVNGTGNPRLLSGGISEALITTQAGLLTAVPILLLHAWIGREVDQRQSVLEQTAASLLTVGEEEGSGTGEAAYAPIADAGRKDEE
jgi:biopolymer transport protein ExbB